MADKRITVFTPTFNRAYIIHNLYQSLCRQTFMDFEWLIVDDGSDDGTRDLVSGWETDAPFRIRYYWQQNGGKHRAVNHGLDLARGEIFFVVDSDDQLTSDALYKIDDWFSHFPDRSDLAGIVANKGLSEEKTVNHFFSSDYLDKTFLDMNTYRENGELVLNGERAIAFYTEVHKKYRYPVYEDEKFMTEAVVYNRMAHDGYKLRFFNDIIWIYEYQSDGLSADGTEIYLRNPRGYGLWFRERADFMNWSIFQKWKMRYSFYCDLRDRYPVDIIAKSIGTSALFIHACKMVFRIKHWSK